MLDKLKRLFGVEDRAPGFYVRLRPDAQTQLRRGRLVFPPGKVVELSVTDLPVLAEDIRKGNLQPVELIGRSWTPIVIDLDGTIEAVRDDVRIAQIVGDGEGA